MAANEDTSFPVPREELKHTRFGHVKRCHAITKVEWSFFAVSLLSIVLSIGFTIHRLLELPKSSDDFTFALVLLFTALMCAYYVIHGIFKERPYEIAVFLISVIVVLIYSIINLVGDPTMLLKQIRLGVAGIFGLVSILLGIVLLTSYSRGKFLFRISALADKQSKLKMRFFCQSAIVFDLQLQGSMLIFVLDTGVVTDAREQAILGLGAVLTASWVMCAYCGMGYRKIWVLYGSIVLALPAFGYIVYRMVIVQSTNPVGSLFYNAVMACAILALIAHAVMIICVGFVIRNLIRDFKEELSQTTGREEGTTPIQTDTAIRGVHGNVRSLNIQES